MDQRRSVFVGRGDELQTLAAAVERATAGEARVVLVGGEPGIGKSTLVRELATRSGVPLFVGSCVRGGAAQIPLAPIIGLVRAVRRARPELLGELGAFDSLAELVPGQLFDATLELLDAVSREEPALVVFEDLHDGDVLTWDLFAFLARSVSSERTVLAATFRPNEVGANPAQRRLLAEIGRGVNVDRFHLAGLTRTDVALQVERIFPDAPPGFVDEVAGRAQGNPLFVEQLVSAARNGDPTPGVVTDLFSAEIADLPQPTQDVLTVVATVGRRTAHDLLVTVLMTSDEDVEDRVRPALAAGTLVVDDDGYALRHPLLAEVIVDTLLPSQRRRIHRQVAAALTDHPALGLSPLTTVGEIAYHLDRAGDRTGAFAASLAAADALADAAPASGYVHLERALALWNSEATAAATPTRTERLWQAAELAHLAGEAERAVELGQAGFDDMPSQQLSAADAWRHERLGRYLWLAGRLDDSQREYAKAADLLGDDLSWAAANVYTGLAQGAMLFCHHGEADAWCRRALTIADQLAGPRDRAALHAERVLAVVCADTGRVEEGLRRGRAALVEAFERNDPERSLTSVYLAETLAVAGDYEQARAVAMEGAKDARRSGLERSIGAYLVAMAADHSVELGELDEAGELLDSVAGVDVVPVTAMRIALAVAILAVRRGDVPRAREAIATAASFPVDTWHLVDLGHRVAVQRLAERDWDGAVRSAHDGLELVAPEDRRWPARFCLDIVTGEVERTLDALAGREPVDADAICSKLERDIATATATSVSDDATVLPDVQVYLAQARAEVTRIGGSGDVGAWAQVADGWRALRRPWQEAYADMRLAEAAAADGQAAVATDALRRAHATATDLGAALLIEEIEAVSRRTRIRTDAPIVLDLTEDAAATLGLTAREAEILGLVSAGLTNRDIGERLYVSDKTVSVHVSNILRKLGVTSRIEAAAVAQRVGLDSGGTTIP